MDKVMVVVKLEVTMMLHRKKKNFMCAVHGISSRMVHFSIEKTSKMKYFMKVYFNQNKSYEKLKLT